MHIFCTECGKHIDVSLEELENQRGHLVCPQCLAEIDVDVELFNADSPAMPRDDDDTTVTPERQAPPSHTTPPPAPSTSATGNIHQEDDAAAASTAQPPHIDDVMRYCKHCGAFLREGVNFCPKCGKYVRVSPPPNFNAPMTAAQQGAARLRASTPPAHRTPPNKQSTYKPPQEPNYQASPVKQQRNPNSSRNGTRQRADYSKKSNGTKPSKFSIHSLGGCLTLTIVAVALFFIIFIIIGVTSE